MRLWFLGAILAVFLGCWSGSSERALAVPPGDLLAVEVSGVGALPDGTPVVLLREPESGVAVPIFIGPNEAEAIARGLQQVETPRPLTHELLGRVIERMRARLVKVYVDDMADGAYLGMLELRVRGRMRPLRLDCRPSDAIALALRTGASIHVSRQVLAEAGKSPAVTGSSPDSAGIAVAEATDALREVLGLPEMPGVVVAGAGVSAIAAGLSVGALVLEVNGAPVRNPEEFRFRARETPPGGLMRLRIRDRAGERILALPVTWLGEEKEPQQRL